jgi:PTS system mannitol-specific IIC component
MNESQFNLKVAVQRLGTALSGMVMPNIGGFIAWDYHRTLYSNRLFTQ